MVHNKIEWTFGLGFVTPNVSHVPMSYQNTVLIYADGWYPDKHLAEHKYECPYIGYQMTKSQIY